MFTYKDSDKERLSTIQTPPIVAEWLCSLIRQRYRPTYVVDPACGEGNLLWPWIPRDRRSVMRLVGVDVKNYEMKRKIVPHCFSFLQKPFEHFTLEDLEELTGIDDDDMMSQERPLIMCNPPFNGNWRGASYPEVFMRKIVELWGKDVPLVFIAPMGFRLNQKKLSERTTWMRDHGPRITSIISCPVDMFPDTQFHTEILICNIPKLEPHYWLPPKVRGEL